MTSLTRKSLSFMALCAIGVPMAAFVAGCKKEEPPPPPPPPPPPKATTVDPQSVAEYLTLNPKVNLQDAKSLDCSEDEVKAILVFMSSFAAGDADALRPMMDSTGRKVLDNLVESGRWQETTSEIIEVNLVDRVSVPLGGGNVVTFNVVMPRAGRLQQDWLVTQRGDLYQFAPFAMVPVSKQSIDAAMKAIKDAGGGEGKDGTPATPEPGKQNPTQPQGPQTQPGKGPGGG